MRDRAHAARLTRMTALMTYRRGASLPLYISQEPRAGNIDVQSRRMRAGALCPLASPCSLVAFSAGWIRPRHHGRNARVCSRSQEKRRYTPAPRRCPQGRNWALLAGRRAIAPAMGRQACACSTYKRQRYCGCMDATPASSASSGHVGLGMLGTGAVHELRRSRAPAFPPPVQPCGRAIRPRSR